MLFCIFQTFKTDLLQTPESPDENDQLHIYNGSQHKRLSIGNGSHHPNCKFKLSEAKNSHQNNVITNSLKILSTIIDGGVKKKSTSLNNLHNNGNRAGSNFTKISTSSSMSMLQQPRSSTHRPSHALSSTRSPLWTALTHAQTITDYVDS